MGFLDENIVEGWDRHGIHCWSLHSFDSFKFIEVNSTHIALVDRTMSDGISPSGTVVPFNFRKYVNRCGDERFVMVCIDDDDVIYDGGAVRAWITDKNFFKSFCDEMLKGNEIEWVDYAVLMESCGVDVGVDDDDFD